MDLKDVAVVIPARISSTRLPEKCLLPLGKYNIIQTVYLRAKSSGCGQVIVACDSKKIIDCIKDIGGEAFLTSSDCMSGTDRIAEIADKINHEYIVNVQGDEPFISTELIRKVALPLFDRETVMSTLAKRITVKKAFNDSNKVKVILDDNYNAIYFSRSVIPFPRDSEEVDTLLHIGIYAYTKDFLKKFVAMPQGRLEKIERLEQLRVLENSYKIKVTTVEYDGIGIDTKEDYDKACMIIKNGGF